MSIDDITTVDDLGYSCIDAKYLDAEYDNPALAFTLAGKVRMPRTCLPEPCARALTQSELSNLTGTEMVLPRFQKEWDDYYARYAEVCRKETVPFGRQQYSAPPWPMTPEVFWTPLLTPPIVTDDLITNLAPPFGYNAPPFRRPGRTWTPIVRTPAIIIANPPIGPASDTGSNTCTAIPDGTSFWVIESDPTGRTCRAGGGTAAGSSSSGSGTTPTTPPTPAPVPVPPAMGMLGSVIAALALMGRRRRARI
ncbi:hypothetical protein AB3Y40_07530 [Yoonia sp. R2331]|uniref:hypothetical protein n=1 Tax=Yoonia sp. R2331 TaxID=3237238 RepID=UPI0034E4D1F8